MRVFLAWQQTANPEVKHVRRYDADNNEKFLGWQMQNFECLEWLEKNGNPTWPLQITNGLNLFNNTSKIVPFEEYKDTK